MLQSQTKIEVIVENIADADVIRKFKGCRHAIAVVVVGLSLIHI